MELFSDEQLLEELAKRFDNNRENIRELEKLTDDLKKMNTKLLEAESLKSNFVSNIANELVNPFSSIIALSSQLVKLEHRDWEKVKKLIDLIHSEAFNLDFQLRNIFAAAKIEAGELTPEVTTVEVIRFLRNVLEIFHIEMDKKEIQVVEEFCCSEDCLVKIDSGKLKLVLINVLSNAIKFSSQGSEITLSASVTDKDLIVRIKDCGIGISEENKKIIFDRFSRADSGLNSMYRGHGLGLSITKAYLDAIDGTIEINSKIGSFTEVIISVPELNNPTTGFATGNDEFIFDDDFTF